jgi:hypothetical protein
MLSWFFFCECAALLAQAAAEKQPLLLRLDGATRAKVLAALAGLVMLGFLLVVLTWLGARMTRRYMGVGTKLKPTKPPGDEEWARPVIEPPEPRKKKG